MPAPSSGFILQSTFGTHGNFELVVPSELGGLIHYWRDNDGPSAFPWSGPIYFGSGDVDAVTLIQSNLGTPGLGHLEAIAREGNLLAHYWREDQYPFMWHGPFYFATGVSGNPALIQSKFGTTGNFELVVPLVSGGLVHLWRDNDDPETPWYGPTMFATELGQIEGVALMQSNFGDPGNLEVVAAVSGDQPSLFHYWRDSGPSFAWHGPNTVPLAGLPQGVFPVGVPGFIQSSFGSHGNFELVMALSNGWVAHLWRNNDDPTLPWSSPIIFEQDESAAEASLIQSNFSTEGPGHLEVVTRLAPCNYPYWRLDGPPFAWDGPTANVCEGPFCDKETHGEWRVPYSSSVVGIHAALLHTGKVLLFSYQEGGSQDFGISALIDPETGEEEIFPFLKNLFCSGQAFLSDGRLLVAGGDNTGVKALHTFTPMGDSGIWQYLGDLAEDRWYPTCATLPSGDVFIISGTKNGGGDQLNPTTCTPQQPVNDTYEIFDPESGLSAPSPAPILNYVAPYSLYPFVYVLPNGKMLIHANKTSYFLNLMTWTFDAQVLSTVSSTARTYPSTGTSVLLPLKPETGYQANVMLIGGAGASCPVPVTPGTMATNTCEILDFAAAPLAWKPAAPMANPRVVPNSVLLPDGTVLVIGGSSIGYAPAAGNPVFAAELYNPETDTWIQLCAKRVQHLYHATALLLPDGRVFTAGTDKFNPVPYNFSEYRIEIFSPPYLFRGPRPTITAAPTDIDYGMPFEIGTPDAAAVTSAVLISPGAVTHSFNMTQRYVGLEITSRSVGSLTLQAPPSSYVAPPGYYMLFILNADGVPSVAKFVHLS